MPEPRVSVNNNRSPNRFCLVLVDVVAVAVVVVVVVGEEHFLMRQRHVLDRKAFTFLKTV
jgi:hypothetical protein